MYYSILIGCLKDTVSTDVEDDEIDADQNAWEGRASIGQDAVVHDGVPAFSCQHLAHIDRRLQVPPLNHQGLVLP